MSEATPGLLLVVSSPSGAGKTTLCRRLCEEFPRARFSVSFTTRKPRPGERDGVDYHFIDGERFRTMIAADELAEWAEVHGNHYGTGMDAVRQALRGAGDVVFDIDYQGGRQIRARFAASAVTVFVLPPSMRELEARLRRRATDSPEVIARRLEKARQELEHYGEYDYLVMNDDLEQAYAELRAIYLAAHVVRPRVAAAAEGLIHEGAGQEGKGAGAESPPDPAGLERDRRR
jgi:guanylate kinase